MFGGRGVGFVPTTSVAASYRGTIRHKFNGWNTYYMKRRNSSDIDSQFLLSAFYSTPSTSLPTIEYQVTSNRKQLDSITAIRYYFVSRDSSNIKVMVNDTICYNYSVSPSEQIQSLSIVPTEGTYTKKIKFSGDCTPTFISYGASFEGNSGVLLDNLSDRGSSGMQMTKISSSRGVEFAKLSSNYSLIILQYGLNVMYAGQNNYKYFENKIVESVERLKTIYPESAFLILGVSDRKMKTGGNYIEMKEIEAMEIAQRNVAKRTHSLFWSINKAMRSEGGISQFVTNGWAAKDHVHINHRGAKVISKVYGRIAVRNNGTEQNDKVVFFRIIV